MNINQIDISTAEAFIILKAVPGQINICDSKTCVIISQIPIYTKGYTTQIQDIMRYIECILELYRPDNIMTEYSTTEHRDIFKKEYSLDELFDSYNKDKEYREKYFNGNCDGIDCDTTCLYSHYCNEIIKSAIIQLASTTFILSKMEDIKDTECPVLKEPLDKDAIKFLKCSHYISGKAYHMLKQKSNTVKCPLCRAEHHSGEVV